MSAPEATTPSVTGAEARRRTEKILAAFHDEERFTKTYDAALAKRLWLFLAPHRGLLLLSIAILLVTSALSLVRPLLMKYGIDHAIPSRDRAEFFRVGLLFAGVLVAEQVLGFVQTYAMQIVGARAMADLRRHVFRFLHGRRLAFFDRQLVGRLVSRVTNDVDAILEAFASGAVNGIGDVVKLVGIVVLMVMLDWKLSIIAFVAVPPVALAVAFIRRPMREALREIRARTSRMNAIMNEQVTGMTLIQAYGRQAGAQDDFDESNAAYRDANMKSIKWEAIQDAAIDMVGAVCLASIIVALGYRPVSFGTVVAFSAYLSQFFEPISQLAQRYTLVQGAMTGAERVFSLLEIGEVDCEQKPAAPAGRSGARAVRSRMSRFRTSRTRRCLSDVSLCGTTRREGRARRSHGLGQDDDHGADAPALRCGGRRRARLRRRRARSGSARAPAPFRGRSSGRRPVSRHDRRQRRRRCRTRSRSRPGRARAHRRARFVRPRAPAGSTLRWASAERTFRPASGSSSLSRAPSIATRPS